MRARKGRFIPWLFDSGEGPKGSKGARARKGSSFQNGCSRDSVFFSDPWSPKQSRNDFCCLEIVISSGFQLLFYYDFN